MKKESSSEKGIKPNLRKAGTYMLASLSIAAMGPATAQAKLRESQRRMDSKIQHALNADASIVYRHNFGDNSAYSEFRHGNKATLDELVDVKKGFDALDITAPSYSNGTLKLKEVSGVSFSENLVKSGAKYIPVVRLSAIKRPDGSWVLNVRDEDPNNEQVRHRVDAIEPVDHERRAIPEGVTSYLGQLGLIIKDAEQNEVPQEFGLPLGF